MHMTSKGPVTTEEHVLITVQTSFSAYINENWLTIKGPYGSSVESIKAAEVKNTYYVGIGLHYPAGKTKVGSTSISSCVFMFWLLHSLSLYIGICSLVDFILSMNSHIRSRAITQ